MRGARTALAELLREGPVLLSGACGTELLRRGVPTPLPLWSAAAVRDHPLTVAEIHRDHARAGARIVTANTFRTDRRTLARAGIASGAGELTRRAVQLAREGVAAAATGRTVLVAGSIAPLEDCYRPDLVPDDAALRLEHSLRVRDLLRAGADLALVETMNTVREARAALGACRAGGLPALVSYVVGESGSLLSGESLESGAAAAAECGALAVLVNCCAPAAAPAAVQRLARATSLPVGAYPNGPGEPDENAGWRFEGGTSPQAFLAAATACLDAGARLIGGCCGSTPRDIAALRALLDGRS